MNNLKSILFLLIGLIILVSNPSCTQQNKVSQNSETPTPSINKAQMEDEAWLMEEMYWEYVQNIDTVAYKTLWHKDFIGYPSFGDGVSDKSKIATWIPDLHKDPELKYSYTLHKKASNAIEDVVMVFYDTDYFWTDLGNNIVKKETYKFTHTWKKVDGQWVILGGMAAMKSQDILND